MDSDLNNEFITFLLNSILSGIGVPATLIDALTNDIDYARTLSAQNANFVRMVIRYQKKLTKPFTRLFRTLYENETKFTSKGEYKDENEISVENIEIKFPSPASLNMTNLSEQVRMGQEHAEFIAQTLIPNADSDPEMQMQKQILMSKVAKDSLPNIEWDKYEKMFEQSKSDIVELKEKLKKEGNPDDEYGGGGYGY